MTIYLFAGPNGSGKSSVIANYISFYGLDDVEYICLDIYASELFSAINDIYERYGKAMDFAEINRLIEDRTGGYRSCIAIAGLKEMQGCQPAN